MDVRDFLNHIAPTGDSALFREQNPKSWWWTAEIDFLSSILVTLQGANWQRGSGKGKPPDRIDRPKESGPKRKVEPPSEKAVEWRRQQEEQLKIRREQRRKVV